MEGRGSEERGMEGREVRREGWNVSNECEQDS